MAPFAVCVEIAVYNITLLYSLQYPNVLNVLHYRHTSSPRINAQKSRWTASNVVSSWYYPATPSPA